MLDALSTQVQQLVKPLTDDSAALSSGAPLAISLPLNLVPVSEPYVGVPKHYAVDPENCNPFITKCSILFSLQPHTFTSQDAQVVLPINHLTLSGSAHLWGTAKCECRTPACGSFQALSTKLHKIFGVAGQDPNSTRDLLNVHQKGRNVAHCSIDLHTWAHQGTRETVCC